MRTGDPPARDGNTGGGELRSVANALRLLSQLAHADGSLGVTELSRVLGVAPSTTYRLLSTLAAHGFATRLPDERRYRRGPELARVAGPLIPRAASTSPSGARTGAATPAVSAYHCRTLMA